MSKGGILSDGTYRGRWMDEVFRTPAISAEVKVFLLFLAARHMSPDGRVSEARSRLAEGLGCYERRINERFDAAIKAGLMERVSRGQKHQTAVYCAAIPDLPAPQRASNPPAEQKSQGADSPPAEPPQGAGTPPTEQNPQGAKKTPAENPQGADSPPSETFSAGGYPAPHIYTHLPEDDHGTVVAGDVSDEKNEKTHTPRVRAADAFDSFWAAYPRHIAKAAARKSFARAVKNGADPQQIIWGARAYASSPRRSESDIKYTAHPATWLNQERWEDDIEPAEPTGRPAPRLSTRDEAFLRHQALGAEMFGTDSRPSLNIVRGELA